MSQMISDHADTSSTPPTEATGGDDIVIKCTGLTKVFRDFWFRSRVMAVDQVDLEVRRGEVFGLLGPNGSGKSTTIKLMLGLLHATAGRISVFGKRPEDVAIKNQIGYLPEESDLYRFLNARETLEYYGRLFRQARPQRVRRIDMLLKMVGLDAVQRRPVGEYSKGMRRRIGLAQALINDPQLLILDEPTTGLDPIGTNQIKDLIRTLRDRGKTILLCSHLLAEVEDVCDRVAIMYGGRVQREGTIDDLLTEQDATTLRVDHLDPETIDQIEALLARRGKHIAKIEHPRQKLEALFLEIVHQAQTRGAATSGARSGDRIAQFLSGEDRGAHLPQSTDAAAMIDKLVSKDVVAPASPADEPMPDAAVPPSVDHSVLAELTSPGDDDQAPDAAPQHDMAVLADLTELDSSQADPDSVPKPPGARPSDTVSDRRDGERPDQGVIDALSNAPVDENAPSDDESETPDKGTGSR